MLEFEKRFVKFLEFEEKYYHLFLYGWKTKDKQLYPLIKDMQEKEEKLLKSIVNVEEFDVYVDRLYELYKISFASPFLVSKLTKKDLYVPALRLSSLLIPLELFLDSQYQTTFLIKEAAIYKDNDYIKQALERTNYFMEWLEVFQTNFLASASLNEEDTAAFLFSVLPNKYLFKDINKKGKMTTYKYLKEDDYLGMMIDEYLNCLVHDVFPDLSLDETMVILESFLVSLPKRCLPLVEPTLMVYLNGKEKEPVIAEKLRTLYQKYALNFEATSKIILDNSMIDSLGFTADEFFDIAKTVRKYFANAHYIYYLYDLLASNTLNFPKRMKVYNELRNCLAREKEIIYEGDVLLLKEYVSQTYWQDEFSFSFYAKALLNNDDFEQEHHLAIWRLQHLLTSFNSTYNDEYWDFDDEEEEEKTLKTLETENSLGAQIDNYLYFLNKNMTPEDWQLYGKKSIYYLHFIFPGHEEENFLIDFQKYQEYEAPYAGELYSLGTFDKELECWEEYCASEIENVFFQSYVDLECQLASSKRKKEIEEKIKKVMKDHPERKISLQRKL